ICNGFVPFAIDQVEAWKRWKIIGALWIIKYSARGRRGGPPLLVILNCRSKDPGIEYRHFSPVVIGIEVHFMAGMAAGIFGQSVIAEKSVINDSSMIAARIYAFVRGSRLSMVVHQPHTGTGRIIAVTAGT